MLGLESGERGVLRREAQGAVRVMRAEHCGVFVQGATHLFFFFQAEDGIRDVAVTGVQTCALPISILLLIAWTTWAGGWRSRRKNAVTVAIRNLPPPARGDRKSVRVGKECRSRWSPYH